MTTCANDNSLPKVKIQRLARNRSAQMKTNIKKTMERRISNFILLLAVVAGSFGGRNQARAQGQLSRSAVVSERAAIREFQRRINEFMRIHKEIEAQLKPLRPTPVAKEVVDYQQRLALAIVEARKGANQGDVFSPNVVPVFQGLIATALRGRDGANIRASLAHAEPVRIEVSVNTSYPPDVPLQSTPPSLLFNLPKLPPQLDYRIVGNALVLRDVTANLIVDFMPNALPEEQER
jgi:hypothetical protein